MISALLALTLVVPSADLRAVPTDPENEPERRVVMVARAAQTVVVDGRLDENPWNVAPEITGFKQREPVEGAEPTQQTIVRIVFDDQALYVGAHLYDASPDSIVARLGRRDADLDTDQFMFTIDPYLDRRSGYYFAVSAAGSQSDGVLFNDDGSDNSWDGVWQSATRLDSTGWTVEMRIPYSQLRFYKQDEYTWGINFRRDISRNHERDYLIVTPSNERGFVSRFADLKGITSIKPPRQIELLPYIRTAAEYTNPDQTDPFNDGSRYIPDAGLDLKVGITSNLTLNATVNPDFGQVEVDPAVVNLSDNETFYPEKRPFFIEGSTIFSFGFGGTGSHWGFNWGTPDFFYSRRIGRAPAGSLPDYDYADVPDGTRILGAAKVTGKMGGDWNVGTVHALTAREFARYNFGSTTERLEVEPTTYYGVARAQKEWDGGRRALGFIGTTSQRSLGQGNLRDQMNAQSYVVGVDGWTFLDSDRMWVVTGWGGLSSVHGSQQRMTDLQESPLHYFQRPDAGHVRVDSNATAMQGFGGRILLNKQKGNILLNTAIGTFSPGFDLNDLGYQWRADYVNMHFAGGYQWTKPTRLARNALILGSLFQSLDYQGNTVWRGAWSLLEIQMLNYYSGNFTVAYNPPTVNNRLTRGGPLTRNPSGYELNANIGTDSRKSWVFGLNGGTYRSDGGTFLSTGVDVSWKPASNVSLTLSPAVQFNDETSQWVDRFLDPTAVNTYGARYVFAKMNQVTVSSSVRLNWTFTPRVSFQLYAQPLISAGDYRQFKELLRPRSYDFLVYGSEGSTYDPQTNTADPDGDGPAASFELPQTDFNFKSLRGNAVFRWEYRPGSTLYFVWTQSRSLSDDWGQFRFGNSLSRMLEAKADNIFMIKLSYWIGR